MSGQKRPWNAKGDGKAISPKPFASIGHCDPGLWAKWLAQNLEVTADEKPQASETA